MRGNVDGGSSLLSLSLYARCVVWGWLYGSSWGDALLCVEGGLILSIINISHICLDCLQPSSYCFCDRHLPVMRPIKSELKGQQKASISQYYSINWWLELYEHSLLIQQKNMENLFYFSVTASHIAFLSSFQIEKYDCPSKEIPDNFFHWPTPHCSIVY